MPATRTTLAQFLSRQRPQDPAGELESLVLAIARLCAEIAEHLADGDWHAERAGRRTLHARDRYLLAFLPLDGADVAQPGGSVFSVLRASDEPEDLPPGSDQVCAGYALYGAATVLVLTMGAGVVGFTLDRRAGEFVLTHSEIRIPSSTSELCVDTATRPSWEPAVRRYVDECLAGRAGGGEKDFTLHWASSLVAVVHRILTGGGVFLCPPRPHLLFEANPVAMLIEQAGGRASTGRRPVLDVVPESLDQRTGLVFGAHEEVRRIEAYHVELLHGGQPDVGVVHDIPFFSSRGLFRMSG
jgi:fructose-1,6-bisphosphatase I/sedoheptulose-1,7-bisphosphatase